MFREIREVKNNETRKQKELGFMRIKPSKEFNMTDEEIMLFFEQEIMKEAQEMALN